MKNGIVISDTHFFAKRSDMNAIEKKLYSLLPKYHTLILNGDIFDFRWSELPSYPCTLEASIKWLDKILQSFPSLKINYILGNHDCKLEFIHRLKKLEKIYPNFHIYEYYLQIGTSLFLHGDCANKLTTFEELKKSRSYWAKTKQWPPMIAKYYQFCDIIKITDFLHHIAFPNKKTAERIIYYLQTIPSGLLSNIKNIYFGHTHLPLTNYQWENYFFHNCGSGIKNHPLNILNFDIDKKTTNEGL